MTATTPDAPSTELPTDIGWGWLDWRLMFFDGDGGDANDAPDLIPAAGAIITATPNVQLASHLTGTTFTAGKRAIQGIIDTQGRLCRKNAASGMPEATPGLPVIATDSAALSSQGFAYEITVSHPALKIGKFSTQVSAGERVDLAERIGQSVPPGTQVPVLTRDIRAEIEKAVASVTPTLPDDLVKTTDLSAYATSQALSEGLSSKVNSTTYTAAIGDRYTKAEVDGLIEGVEVDTTGLVTPEQAEQIALQNALLNEDQPVTKAAVVDGALVLTRRDGVEITTEGQIATGATVRTLTWNVLNSDPVWLDQDGGWITKSGQVVTLCLRNVKLVAGARVTPPAMTGGTVAGRLVMDVLMVNAQGVAARAAGDLSEWEYDAAIFVPGTRSGTTESPEVIPELRITWATADPAPLTIGTAISDA